MNNDTIFALSSAPGKSGVAVIRISGENLNDLAHHIFPSSEGGTAERWGGFSRHAYFTNLRDKAGDLIDQCIRFTLMHPALSQAKM